MTTVHQLPCVDIMLSSATGQMGQAIQALTLRDLIMGLNDEQQVEISSQREGEVIGTHEVCLSSADEVLTLTHEANDRRIFAQGAVQAAQRPCGREPGLFGLAQVLGLTANDEAVDSNHRACR